MLWKEEVTQALNFIARAWTVLIFSLLKEIAVLVRMKSFRFYVFYLISGLEITKERINKESKLAFLQILKCKTILFQWGTKIWWKKIHNNLKPYLGTFSDFYTKTWELECLKTCSHNLTKNKKVSFQKVYMMWWLFTCKFIQIYKLEL